MGASAGKDLPDPNIVSLGRLPDGPKDWNGPRTYELEGQPASRASEYRITGIMADRGASVWLARGAQIATEYS